MPEINGNIFRNIFLNILNIYLYTILKKKIEYLKFFYTTYVNNYNIFYKHLKKNFFNI